MKTKVCVIYFVNDCSRAETSKINLWPKLEHNKPKTGPKWGFPAFSFLLYQKRKDLIKLIFYHSFRHRSDYRNSMFLWLHKYFSPITPVPCITLASFFRHRIVEWPSIEFKMYPMLLKKSWNLFYSNVVRRPFKLACFH